MPPPNYPPNNDAMARETLAVYAMADRMRHHSQMNAEKFKEFVEHLMRCRYYHDVEGDLVECGVWRGASAAMIGRIFQGKNKALHLYDSFEGMPAPTENDFTRGVEYPGKVQGDGGTFGKGSLADTSVAEVRERLRNEGISNVVIHKGFITGPENFADGPQKIAVLHVDLDFYEPYKVTLDALYPRMALHGSIIFDDYGHFIGAKRAVDEFIERTGEKLIDADGTSRRIVHVEGPR